MTAVFGLALSAAVALGAGSGPAPDPEPTRAALVQVGYVDPRVEVSRSGGRTEVRIEVGVAGQRAPAARDADEVAGVAWTTLALRFDRLTVVVAGAGGTAPHGYDRGELVARFGPRLPELDVATVGPEPRRPTGPTVAAVAAGLGALALVVVVVARRPRPG